MQFHWYLLKWQSHCCADQKLCWWSDCWSNVSWPNVIRTNDFQREDFYGTSSLLVGFKPLVSGLWVKCSTTALLKDFKPSQNSNFEVLVSLYVVKQKFEVYIPLQCCPLYHTITKNMQFHWYLLKWQSHCCAEQKLCRQSVCWSNVSRSNVIQTNNFQREDFYWTSSLLVGFKPVVIGLWVKCSTTALQKDLEPTQNSNFDTK